LRPSRGFAAWQSRLPASSLIERQRQYPHRLLIGMEAHRVFRFDEVEQELRAPLMSTR
jgi:hypothetical protein